MLTKFTVLLLSVTLIGFAHAYTSPSSDQESDLVNLARLSITKVSASEVNGSRPLDNVYYGVQNMFDDGLNIINGINYSYWLGTHSDSGAWVRISFDTPVTVNKLVIQFRNSIYHTSGIEEKKEYALQITTQNGKSKKTDYYDSKRVTGFVMTNSFSEPLHNVCEIKVMLSGFHSPAIEEILVLGTPPPGVDTTPQTPQVVEDPISQHHTISISCDFEGEDEARMLKIAENTPPMQEKEEQMNWWYDEIDSIKLPYALTSEAVDYYAGQIMCNRNRNWGKNEQHDSRLIYHASVKRSEDLCASELKLDQEGVNNYIVDLFMEFSSYTASGDYIYFTKSRRVTLDERGNVLAITGDMKTETSLNQKLGT
ncbi:MAG TPA: discoidin domain-containing protein [Armatimonadota bacterium]|nr:discoidin domain-containing protein [Armatimonadota bacterium]HOM72517.1 discoidin domain-containing protein [Armatimonadota bacterium]